MGEYLSKPDKTKHSNEGENSWLRFGASSMQSWRRSNEDAHITALDISNDISVFGVFDGHGGVEVARYVEYHLVDILQKNAFFKKGEYKKALEQTFCELDKMLISPEGLQELKQISMKEGNLKENPDPNQVLMDLAKQAGCTACLVLITKTEIYCANAGDTRCVLAQKGKSIDLSIDHKPELMTETKRIQKDGGFIEDGRVQGIIAVSRAIGDWEYKKQTNAPEVNMVTCFPEIKMHQIKAEDDFMIIACDGIWDCMESQEAVKFVYKENEKQKNPSSPSKRQSLKGSKKKESKSKHLGLIVEKMMDKNCPSDLQVTEGIGADNMTCIIVELNKKLQGTSA